MFTTYYIQVLSLGFVWTFFHCAGMCGPLVAGLTCRPDDPPEGWSRIIRRSRRVLAYQLGRALTYAAMGAAVGFAGSALEQSVQSIAALSAFVVAPFVVVLAVARLSRRSFGESLGGKVGSYLGVALRVVRRATTGRGDVASSLGTGVVLGLLPCMLMFWTLGIAATTASPLHGAGVMLTLVGLTTPTLLVAGCAAGVWRARWSERAVGFALLASAAWMLIVALAANEVIPHAHVTFQLMGEPYMLMFY